MAYCDSLRGYAYKINLRDNFTCVYCGLDGRQWPNWLFLSWDHLLPKGHPNRNNEDFIVTACRFCNGACNRTIFNVENKKPEEIVALKKVAIELVRSSYKNFFNQYVKFSRSSYK